MAKFVGLFQGLLVFFFRNTLILFTFWDTENKFQCYNIIIFTSSGENCDFNLSTDPLQAVDCGSRVRFRQLEIPYLPYVPFLDYYGSTPCKLEEEGQFFSVPGRCNAYTRCIHSRKMYFECQVRLEACLSGQFSHSHLNRGNIGSFELFCAGQHLLEQSGRVLRLSRECRGQRLPRIHSDQALRITFELCGLFSSRRLRPSVSLLRMSRRRPVSKKGPQSVSSKKGLSLARDGEDEAAEN